MLTASSGILWAAAAIFAPKRGTAAALNFLAACCAAAAGIGLLR